MKECMNCRNMIEDSMTVCPICKTKIRIQETDNASNKTDTFIFVCPKHHKQYSDFPDNTPVPGWTCTCGKGLSFVPYVGTAYPKPIYSKPEYALTDPLSETLISDLSDKSEVVIGRKDFKYKSAHKMYGTLSHDLFSIVKNGDKDDYILKVLTNHSGIVVNNRIAAYNSEIRVKNGARILINNFLYLTISEKR